MYSEKYLAFFNLRRALFNAISQVIQRNQSFNVATKSADSNKAGKGTSEVVNKLRLNFEKTLRKPANNITSSKHYYYDPTVVTTTRRRNLPKAASEDKTASKTIETLLQQKQTTEAVKTFHKLAIEDKFPAKNVVNKLAAACGYVGDIENVNMIAEIAEIAFPAEVKFQMRFQHYVAEALWKQGKYQQSLDLFYDLFHRNPHHRTKINNLSAFCIRKVINENQQPHFSDVLRFVDRLAELNDLTSAANLWRISFCDNNYDIQRLSEELLIKYQKKIMPFLQVKVPAVIEEATQCGNSALFQRLISTAIQFEWTELYTKIFGSYIDFLCERNDEKGVRECLKYVANYSIVISAATMEKSMALIVTKSSETFGQSIMEGLEEAPVKFKF